MRIPEITEAPVPEKRSGGPPPILHQDLTLARAAAALDGELCVLTTDDTGRVVGLVWSADIQSRLQVGNPQEKARWEQMTLGALAGVWLEPGHPLAETASIEVDCRIIAGDGSQISLVTREDVFISMRHINRVLSEATSDAVTGLMNRLGFERRLEAEWARTQRIGASLGVILVDLNHFKEVNDCYGHAAGDLVLQQVGAALEKSIRSYDMVARYGGDEFIALCVGCRPAEIEIPIRRILRQLERTTIRVQGKSLRAAAAVGAAVQHDHFGGAHPARLIAAADECLYAAKQSQAGGYYVELRDGHVAQPTPVAAWRSRKGSSPVYSAPPLAEVTP